jgi:hypothetical protein
VPLSEPDLSLVAAILTPPLRRLKDALLADLDVGVPLPAVIDVASVKTWLSNLETETVRNILAGFRTNTAIARALTSLEAASNAAAGTHEVFGRPVVDRDALLNHIAMLHSGGKKILYIHGDRCTGKTFSKWIVKREVQRAGARFAEVDLFGALTLDSVLIGFTTCFYPPPVPPQFARTHSTEDHWARACAQFVFTCGHASGSAPLWLVFDHFDRSIPTIAVTAFFARLVELVETQDSSPSAMKLILIDHQHVVPGARHNAIVERVRVPQEEDIARYYRAKNPSWPTPRIDSEVQRVLASLAGAAPEDWMSKLASVLE